MLVSYIKNIKDLNEQFKFEKTFIFRNKLDDYLKQCSDTDILLCSCYVWNWEITTHFAKEVRKINPNCLIIFGGPQTPNRKEDFFEKYPFIDIIVNNEGEIVLENIFREFLKDKNYLNVKGIQTKDFSTDPQPRIRDLDIIPSPYLSNVVNELIDRNESSKWAFSWETNRGCPYQCTFCDWGSATKTAMRKFSDERLFEEIDYFADHDMPYIECCDANFGIYQERDMAIAKKLKETAIAKNSPKFWQSAWAKFSSEKIIPIAKELQDGGLLTSVTLSVQSLDQTTLDIIKRENMKFDSFTDLSNKFNDNGIPTYSEIIRGLPGETLESFKKGLEIMVTDTKISIIYIFNCGVYVNAPMNEPAYREFNKIQTIRSPIYLAHSSIYDRGIEEYEDIIISTKSFTLDDLKEMYLYSWLVLTFHGFGIFEYVEKYYYRIFNLPVMKFYETFLEFCRTHNSIFSKEYEKVVKFMNDGYSGKGWNHHDPNLGDIYFPIEEASWLRLASKSENLQADLLSFLHFLENNHGYTSKNKTLNDLAKFQVFLITTMDNANNIKSELFEFDWKNFFINNSELLSVQKRYFYKNLVDEKDPIQWNYKAIWYGRGTKQFKFLPEHLQEEQYIEEFSQNMSKRKAFPSP